MKIIGVIFLLVSFLFSIEFKQILEIKDVSYQKENDSEIFGKSIIALGDAEEFKTSVEFFVNSDDEKRRDIYINELFYKKDFREYSFSLGKEIKFWGELEGFNIVDIYNPKNLLLDPFDREKKLGTIGGNLKRFFNSSSIEIGVKTLEPDLKSSSSENPMYLLPLEFQEEATFEKRRETPTLYLKYNFNLQLFDSENTFILYSGYDTKRDLSLTQDLKLQHYLYRVNKLLYFSNVLMSETIVKVELAHTQVDNYKNISNYTQIGLGVEHSFYDILQTDVTLFSEYYKYLYEEELTQQIDVSEIYDNDLFLGFRINFTDVASSEIKVGVVRDLISNEQIVKAEANRRIVDGVVGFFEILDLSPKKESVLENINSHKRYTFGVRGTF